MKKVFITLGVLILVVITALMVIPTFFKGDILQIIEKQSAKYINAKLKIGDMNLSMFKSFPNLNVATKEGKQEYVWATSWGVSTRLMGALIMSHSDDNGLVLPPKLAPLQVAIVPIYKSLEGLEKIRKTVSGLMDKLKAAGISVKFDDRDTQKPGWKFADYELKGVPVRLAMGERDLENGTIEVARRDTLTKETLPLEGVEQHIETLLEEIQENIYKLALERRSKLITKVDSYEEFKTLLDTKGGFFLCHWDGTPETEELIKNETKATIRCIPFDAPEEEGKCMVTGKPSHKRVLIARAY